MSNMPGEDGIATRPLHFIWICDCSGSMAADGKIESLNDAIKQALPVIKDSADSNPFAKVLIRCIKFSNGAEWINKEPIPLENFHWSDLSADGVTDMGKALSMVADELKMPPMEKRGYPPVLVLVSDGQPTDNFDGGLKKLMSESWGKKSVRLSVGIGEGADTEVLQKFIGNLEIKPLVARNSQELVRYIVWASRTGTSTSIAPNSKQDGSQSPPIPQPLPDTGSGGSNPQDFVW
jgi:uncharacterized protein YegL